MKYKKIITATFITVFVTFAVLTVYGFAFTWSKSFCGFCHAKETKYFTLKNKPHLRLNCLDCHKNRQVAGYFITRIEGIEMLFSFATGLYNKPIQAQIDNQACLLCHRQVAKTFTSRGIRVSHKEFLSKGYLCTNCHNTIAHKETIAKKNYPYMDQCLECHNGDIASSNCDNCHTKDVEEKPRYISGPWAITHGRNWKKTHGMGNLKTCSVCHHKDYCKKCHTIELPHDKDIFAANHGKVALEFYSTCTSCHMESFCKNCHQIQMPHPENFLPEHSNITKKIGKENCLRCHIEPNCDECHARHIHPGVAGVKSPTPPR